MENFETLTKEELNEVKGGTWVRIDDKIVWVPRGSELSDDIIQ